MADQKNGSWRTKQGYTQGEGRYEHDFDQDDYERGRWQGGSDWDNAEGSNPYQYGRSNSEWDRDYGRGGSDWNQGYGQNRQGSSEWDQRHGRGGQRHYGQSSVERDRDYERYGRGRSSDRYGSFSREMEWRGGGSAEWNRDYGQGSYDQDQSYRWGNAERNYGSYGRGGYNMMGTSGGRRYGQRRSDWDRDYGRNRSSRAEWDREARPGGYDYGWEGDYSQHFEDYGTTAGLQHRQAPDRSFSEFWSAPGPHYGRGPKGYKRSNERIQEDLCERMTHHGYLNAEDIELEVNNGQVVLKGTVNSRQEKRLAEDIAESVSGVSQVMNQLQVKQQGQEKSWSTEETEQGPSA